MQLAALAFPADPLSFPRVPHPPTMQQEEAVAIRCRSVASIQARDARGGHGKHLVVTWRSLGGGVRPIGEESEADVVLRARQMTNLEPLDLLVDIRWRRQERGDDDHCTQARRHAVAELQAGQPGCAEPIGDAVVHQRHSRIRRRDQSEEREQEENRSVDPELRQDQQRQRQDEGGDDGDRCCITQDARGGVGARQPVLHRHAKSERRLECPPPFRDQVVAGILLAAILGRVASVSPLLGGEHRLVQTVPRYGPGRDGAYSG
jgi:hypothetical protein